jgi:hypothetical protein
VLQIVATSVNMIHLGCSSNGVDVRSTEREHLIWLRANTAGRFRRICAREARGRNLE